MSEMVERVKRAINEALNIYGASDDTARKVIAEMREPTAEMIDAMRDIGPDAPYGVSETAERWRAGVGAALNPDEAVPDTPAHAP